MIIQKRNTSSMLFQPLLIYVNTNVKKLGRYTLYGWDKCLQKALRAASLSKKHSTIKPLTNRALNKMADILQATFAECIFLNE